MATSISLAFVLISIASGGVLTGDDGSSSSPIRLAVQRDEHSVFLQVLGLTGSACEATYALEVSGGGNRSTQRGTVKLEPNRPVKLVNLNLASPGGREWSAKLSVVSCNGTKYEQNESSN